MKDKTGREINYLRISVTKRCNLNCSYCGSKRTARENELTAEEIGIITEVFAQKGISKVRLTGGEPLMREDIEDIAGRIKRVKGIESLYITTNGIKLSRAARGLRTAGVDGVNISLDTLDRELYKELTGVDRLSDVLSGIDAALEAGFDEIKINCVPVRGKNDGEIQRLIAFARDFPIDVRFIELMPFSKMGEDPSLAVPSSELLGRLPFLVPLSEQERGAAKYYTAEGFKGRVGFISPLSGKFCSECNRLRILSDGKVKPCLGCDTVYDIRKLLYDREKLSRKADEIIYNKPLSHHFEENGAPEGLNLIGG